MSVDQNRTKKPRDQTTGVTGAGVPQVVDEAACGAAIVCAM
jgi:hypothetical protein